MKKLSFSLILFVILPFISCTKDHKNCGNETTGTIKSLKLDGCGFVIKLADNSMLEPIQSPDDFTYIDGQTVSFCYEEKPTPSICMVGKTVIIKSIRYLP